MLLESASISRQGSGSRPNEDALLEDPEHGVFAVADGVGGSSHGEVASCTAIQCLKKAFSGPKGGIPAERAQLVLRSAFLDANAMILEVATESAQKMQTTLTAAVFAESAVYLGHSGDSRAYLVAEDSVEQLTEDHTLVAEMVRNDIITEEEAWDHPHRNVLTGCLGVARAIQIPDVDSSMGGPRVSSSCVRMEWLDGYRGQKCLTGLMAA